MKPVLKITATMKTTPATIPTHAATWLSRLCLYGRWAGGAVVVGVVDAAGRATGVVSGD
jgi:hypothetical protein